MKYPRHEYATILVSTMTEEELLNDKNVQFEEFHSPFLQWGEIPKEQSLQKARSFLLDYLKEDDWAKDITKSKSPRFYQTDFFEEHYKIFAQYMQKFTCPICKQPLIKTYNRKRHTEIIGCSSYPSCKFIFNPDSLIEVLDTARQNNWIKI